jgi:hypothetical protein
MIMPQANPVSVEQIEKHVLREHGFTTIERSPVTFEAGRVEQGLMGEPIFENIQLICRKGINEFGHEALAIIYNNGRAHNDYYLVTEAALKSILAYYFNAPPSPITIITDMSVDQHIETSYSRFFNLITVDSYQVLMQL